MALVKALASRLSPAGAQARLSVLIFHRVSPVIDPVFPGEPDARWFDRFCAWTKGWFNVLPLDEAIAMLEQGRLPARAAAISFDDGYADNRTVAMPILARHSLTATFFVATGFLDGGRMWNDTVIESVRSCADRELRFDAVGLGVLPVGSPSEKRAAIESIIAKIKYLPPAERLHAAHAIAEIARVSPPQDLMMTSAQVLEMHRGGMGIGAHTVSHPILARLDRERVVEEIAGSKRSLEKILDAQVGLFAYPNGKPGADYEAKDVEIVRQLGFSGAVSTRPAAATRGCDPFQIPRFTPWERTRFRFGTRMIRNLRVN